MLWVLKRTVSLRRFFWTPKTYIRIDESENIHKFTLKIFVNLELYSYQPLSIWPLKSGNNQGCLLLRLDLLFCFIQLQYECQIFILLLSSGIYTESIRSKQNPYSTIDKCAMIIFDNEKIQKIKLNSEDTIFIDIQVIF